MDIRKDYSMISKSYLIISNWCRFHRDSIGRPPIQTITIFDCLHHREMIIIMFITLDNTNLQMAIRKQRQIEIQQSSITLQTFGLTTTLSGNQEEQITFIKFLEDSTGQMMDGLVVFSLGLASALWWLIKHYGGRFSWSTSLFSLSLEFEIEGWSLQSTRFGSLIKCSRMRKFCLYSLQRHSMLLITTKNMKREEKIHIFQNTEQQWQSSLMLIATQQLGFSSLEM